MLALKLLLAFAIGCITTIAIVKFYGKSSKAPRWEDRDWLDL